MTTENRTGAEVQRDCVVQWRNPKTGGLIAEAAEGSQTLRVFPLAMDLEDLTVLECAIGEIKPRLRGERKEDA
jgi:hypothetical protein